ncbi:hypothetical protein ACE6H2_001742 [Prunus campanulata]
MDQGGGGSNRQVRNNEIRGGQGSKNVGITQSYNGPSQGGLDISDNTIIGGERSKTVGIRRVGNTKPDKGPSCCCIL